MLVALLVRKGAVDNEEYRNLVSESCSRVLGQFTDHVRSASRLTQKPFCKYSQVICMCLCIANRRFSFRKRNEHGTKMLIVLFSI